MIFKEVFGKIASVFQWKFNARTLQNLPFKSKNRWF